MSDVRARTRVLIHVLPMNTGARATSSRLIRHRLVTSPLASRLRLPVAASLDELSRLFSSLFCTPAEKFSRPFSCLFFSEPRLAAQAPLARLERGVDVEHARVERLGRDAGERGHRLRRGGARAAAPRKTAGPRQYAAARDDDAAVGVFLVTAFFSLGTAPIWAPSLPKLLPKRLPKRSRALRTRATGWRRRGRAGGARTLVPPKRARQRRRGTRRDASSRGGRFCFFPP